MQTNPLLSIITVCYNAEQLLAETLDSALSQSMQDFEFVIIDGGSKDNTVSVIKRYTPKIGYWVSEKDKGIYDAMNKGIRHAKGEWIYFLNAGDRFYDNEVLKNVFTGNAPIQADLIYGKVQTINEPTGVNYVAGSEVSLTDFYNKYPINHQSTFTRKKAFETIGDFNTRYRLAADTEWFVRFFKNASLKPLFVDQIVALYDIQGASYHKRMQGYSEYLHFGCTHFPIYITIKNYIAYPFIWMKVKLIRTLTGTAIFAQYRKLKFKNQP